MIDDVPQGKQQRIPAVLRDVNQFVNHELKVCSSQRFQGPMVLDEVDAIPQGEAGKTLPSDQP